jgi:solute carrier family 6 GABA transporter-like protein 1
MNSEFLIKFSKALILYMMCYKKFNIKLIFDFNIDLIFDFRDSIIACVVSSATSLFSGVVIFSVLGHMAHLQNKDVGEVAKSGPGLAFLAYPEVVTRLPISPLWSVLFFLMLLILGIDSQFCTVESFITGIVDEWPRYLRPRRKLFTLGVVVLQFVLGIPLVMGGGMYVFQLMDFFSASGFSLLLVVFTEIVGLCWIFGKILSFYCICNNDYIFLERRLKNIRQYDRYDRL